MTKTFKISLKEFQDAQKLHYSKYNSNFKVLLVIIVSSIVGSLLINYQEIKYFFSIFTFNTQNFVSFLEMLLGFSAFQFVFMGIVIYILILYFSTKILGKRQYLSSAIFQNEFTLHISNDGVELIFATGESKLFWNAYIKYVENDDLYLLYTSNMAFQIIPKHMLSEEEEKNLSSYFETHITTPSKSKNKSFFRWWKEVFVFILFAFIGFFVIQFVMQSLTKFDRTTHLNQIDKMLESKKEDMFLTAFMALGYEKVQDDDRAFKAYHKGIVERFFEGSRIEENSNDWLATLEKKDLKEDAFRPYFKYMKSLDRRTNRANKTRKERNEKIVKASLEFMDKQLEGLLDSNVTVAEVKLFNKEGKHLESMKSSRAYYVSERYREMADFCKKTKAIKCDEEFYIEKAVQSSNLNPNAYFMQAYYSNDTKENIKRLDKVVLLVKNNKSLYHNKLFALYNNLGFDIFKANIEARYDEALGYLKKSYELNNNAVYSLVTMSSIYRKRDEFKKSDEILADEKYAFIHASDDELLEKDNHYWLLARHIIDISKEEDDSNTTAFFCERYLKLHDAYKECDEEFIK